VKCFTCGTVLADKYRYYLEQVRNNKLNDTDDIKIDKIVYFTEQTTKKTHEGKVLDELKLFNVCCRRHILTHVDIE
jgi:DNA-directed RNA polymerase subunit N (RpoN/RPB10)